MNRLLSAGAAAAMTVALVVCSLLVITAQHRARALFAELEREQLNAQRLQAENNRLKIELGRAAQPANVEAAALALGLRRIDLTHTTFLPVPRLPEAKP